MSFEKTSEVMKDKGDYIELEGIKAIIEEISSSRYHPKHQMIILYAIYTGRRISEILNIKVKDINFEKNYINIIKLKDKRKKSQEFKAKYKEYLKEFKKEKKKYLHQFCYWRAKRYCEKNNITIYLDSPESQQIYVPLILLDRTYKYIEIFNLLSEDWLFVSDWNRLQHVNRITPIRTLKRVCKNAGVKTVSGRVPHFHTFRHSFATNFTSEKAKTIEDYRSLQRKLGHSNFASTLWYAHRKDIVKKDKEISKDIEELYSD